MAEFKETRRQAGIQRNTALAKREVRRRQRLSRDKFVTNLEHETYWTQPKAYKILKQISKDVKETAHIQRNICESNDLCVMIRKAIYNRIHREVEFIYVYIYIINLGTCIFKYSSWKCDSTEKVKGV